MAEPWLELDGSQGEGGGQILRTALSLSLVTGRPFRLLRVRAGRQKPGLMRQHLAAVRAAAEIGQAEVTGDAVGSQELTFRPASVVPGTYRFAVGTAGSATLVVQTILPALWCAAAPSEVFVEGGTHNPWAPAFDFLAHAYFPLVNRMGPQIEGELQRWGFYPAGGGQLRISVVPSERLQGWELLERGSIQSRSATAVVAHVPRHVGERELAVVQEKLGWPAESLQLQERVPSVGPGNALILEVRSEHVCEVFTSFGRVGLSAEKVAQEAVSETRDYLAAEVPVGPHLADQLMLPLGLAAWQTGHGGAFRTGPLTLHSLTHIELLRRWLEIPIEVAEEERSCVVRLGR